MFTRKREERAFRKIVQIVGVTRDSGHTLSWSIIVEHVTRGRSDQKKLSG